MNGAKKENIKYVVVEQYYQDSHISVYEDREAWKVKIREVSVVDCNKGQKIKIAIYDAGKSEKEASEYREKHMGTQGRRDRMINFVDIPEEWELIDEREFEPSVVYYNEENKKWYIQGEEDDGGYDSEEDAKEYADYTEYMDI